MHALLRHACCAESTSRWPLRSRQLGALQEFLFRGIQKGEWTNLFQFISVKGLPVANLAEAERGPGGGQRTLDLDLGDDVDTGTFTRCISCTSKPSDGRRHGHRHGFAIIKTRMLSSQ
jgi:hypothetical protein